MTNRIANHFGLVALALSLFASTAFAGNAPAPTQVVVSNTPAQPVPMVGLVKDSDNSARNPFQWDGSFTEYGGGWNNTHKVISVPANQRLVIEDVAGYCQGGVWMLELNSYQLASGYKFHYLPAAFWNGTGPASTPVRFYVNPGEDLDFSVGTTQTGTCNLTVSGYFVNLP